MLLFSNWSVASSSCVVWLKVWLPDGRGRCNTAGSGHTLPRIPGPQTVVQGGWGTLTSLPGWPCLSTICEDTFRERNNSPDGESLLSYRRGREAEFGDVTTISQQARSARSLVSSRTQKRPGKMEGLDQHRIFQIRFPCFHPSFHVQNAEEGVFGRSEWQQAWGTQASADILIPTAAARLFPRPRLRPPSSAHSKQWTPKTNNLSVTCTQTPGYLVPRPATTPPSYF